MALVAKIKLTDLPEVKRLVDEADMAVEILSNEDNTPVVEAVKEGLASALDALRGDRQDAPSGD
jgi:hypothetical protein